MASFTFSFLDGFPYGAGTFGYTTLIDPGKSLKKRADEIYCHKLEDPNFGMNKYGQWLVILSIFISKLAVSFEWVKITELSKDDILVTQKAWMYRVRSDQGQSMKGTLSFSKSPILTVPM